MQRLPFIRALAISVTLASLSLAACADHPKPAPGVEQPKPPAPDPRLCTPIEPAPAVQGGLIQPVTQEQRDAVQAFLNGELDLWGWGVRGWGRAKIAKDAYCR